MIARGVRSFSSVLLVPIFIAIACGGSNSGTRASTPTTPDPASQASTPPGSAGHASDQQMVLLLNAGLGGGGATSSPTRIWGWTGTEWQLLDATGPPVRNLAGVAYDTRRQTIVMHGGTDDTGRTYGETWEWNRSGWRQYSGTTPGLRDHTQMAYDVERGRAVLYGGSGSDPNVAFADTWEFDGTTWEQAATSGPPPRVHHAMHYDPGLCKVVVFGGVTPGGGALGDTWAWDGRTWAPLGSAVAPRTHSRMAFDRHLGALVVAGSLSAAGLDLLVHRDGTWSRLASSPEPSGRHLTALAFDERRNVLVLFGGGAGMTLFADAWEFNGTTWRRAQ